MGARLPEWVRGVRLHTARRALAYGITAVGLITTATAMAALHPHQQVYFNALVDTKTPGALAKRYDMDYYKVAHRQALEYLLARYPDDRLRVRLVDPVHMAILPQDDRERIIRTRNINSANYHISNNSWGEYPNAPVEPTIHGVEAYGNVMSYLFAPKNLEKNMKAYRDVAASGTPLARADFDVYVHNGALHYLSENCVLRRLNLRIFLRIVPANPADLPPDSRERGFESRDFRLNDYAAFFDGKCILTQPLPAYPIARIATGYESAGYEGAGTEWRVDIDLAMRELPARIAAGRYGKPVAQSDFDVYLRGDRLAYLKQPCAPADADARFLLHIIPADPADLPADSRDYGFETLNFQFADHGARIGDICAAERQLPAYPIDRIRAGQFVSGGGAIWQVEFAAAR